MFSDIEREDLIRNLVDALSQCDRVIQGKVVHHFTQADPEYRRRVAEGLGMANQHSQAAE